MVSVRGKADSSYQRSLKGMSDDLTVGQDEFLSKITHQDWLLPNLEFREPTLQNWLLATADEIPNLYYSLSYIDVSRFLYNILGSLSFRDVLVAALSKFPVIRLGSLCVLFCILLREYLVGSRFRAWLLAWLLATLCSAILQSRTVSFSIQLVFSIWHAYASRPSSHDESTTIRTGSKVRLPKNICDYIFDDPEVVFLKTIISTRTGQERDLYNSMSRASIGMPATTPKTELVSERTVDLEVDRERKDKNEYIEQEILESRKDRIIALVMESFRDMMGYKSDSGSSDCSSEEESFASFPPAWSNPSDSGGSGFGKGSEGNSVSEREHSECSMLDKGKKRARKIRSDEGDGTEDAEDGDRRRRSRTSKVPEKDPGKRFACPYRKKVPVRFLHSS